MCYLSPPFTALLVQLITRFTLGLMLIDAGNIRLENVTLMEYQNDLEKDDHIYETDTNYKQCLLRLYKEALILLCLLCSQFVCR